MGRRSSTARAWALCVLALLVGTGCAQAAPRVHHRAHGRDARQHARLPARAQHAVHASLPALIGVGDVRDCVYGSTSGLGVLRTYHAKILRVVIDPVHGAAGEALPCVRAAAASGVRVHISIGYSNRWSTATDVAYFARVLGFYAPYAWAISIGNEQELVQGGATESAARYATVWRAVEPVVAGHAPRAIRVAGEVSPWGLSFLRAAVAARLPGAQAIGVHAYLSHWGFDLPSVVAWARHTRLPVWVTEGLAGPGAWPNGYRGMHAVSRSRMVGVSVADAWLS